MAEPRDLAQQWLTDLLVKRCPGCSEESNGWDHIRPEEAAYLAAAILDQPGVEVDVDRLRVYPKEDFEDEAPYARNPRGPVRITHTQVVIRLPRVEVSDAS